jgi:NACHT domain/NACHT N-terminal Helical domain 1
VSDVENKVVDFFNELFNWIFAQPFCDTIESRIRRNSIKRQIEEVADASSQSLFRFFANQRMGANEVRKLLKFTSDATKNLKLEDVANVHVSPEELADRLLSKLPVAADEDKEAQVRRRVALYSVVQVLLMIGPVMAEWQRVGFSSTFELPRQVVNRLNQVTAQLQVLGEAGLEAADYRFELIYRDYLLQRFHRVEAGTIRMMTNLDVDLRELFVMPKVRKHGIDTKDSVGPEALLGLRSAKQSFRHLPKPVEGDDSHSQNETSALAQVKANARTLLIGAPGSGKSTFLEWLQVKVAGAEEKLILGGRQAIPLLLRLRQLDTEALPSSRDLVAQAIISADRASLMPIGWTERQLQDGKILLMVDGLDEVEPTALEGKVLPWISALIKKYPRCRYVLSSRPVAYKSDKVGTHKFAICELCDFDPDQMKAYSRNWCIARRLARNEPEDEARIEGAHEGGAIVDSFADHPYIHDLARNPLMLSAICLVNFFEGGRLPEDRAVLYRLCVEGLLHNWDQGRGIHSDFTMEEKLRACRELALAMQTDDRAECPDYRVREVFTQALSGEEKGSQLLEQIRYRSGLLLERRPSVFAFAHLTFQEYLAARAVHEGNYRNVNATKLVREYADGRWDEVISLYCGLAPALDARRVIHQLLSAEESRSLGGILADAYISAGEKITKDGALRKKVITRVATAPSTFSQQGLERFPRNEAIQIANQIIGRTTSTFSTSEAYWFLLQNVSEIDLSQFQRKLKSWRRLSAVGLSELIYVSFNRLITMDNLQLRIPGECYSSPGPSFVDDESHELESYTTQAEIAILALASRLQMAYRSSLRKVFAKDWVRDAIYQGIIVISQYSEDELMKFGISIMRYGDPPVLDQLLDQLPSGDRLQYSVSGGVGAQDEAVRSYTSEMRHLTEEISSPVVRKWLSSLVALTSWAIGESQDGS